MEQEQSSVDKFEDFTWKIENFSRYDPEDDVYSEPFVIGGYPWRIAFHQRFRRNLSIYLSAVQTANMSKGWSRHVKFNLFILNQIDRSRSIVEGYEQEFNEIDDIWKFDCMVSSPVLHRPQNGLLVNDTCIIGAEICLCKSKNEKQVNQAFSLTTSLTSGSQIVQMEAEVLRPKLEESHGQNLGELMDFKGLGQIEKDLVPLLEEVCSHHPSLIECQQKRSRKFKEWAFTALGRVLHFLKTTKVKDMNDLACKDLQNFWEELEPFSFDLTWLEPHVQSALGMKNYLKKVKKVEKLKDNAVALELEIMRLKAKVVNFEVNLYAVRDLLKAEDFEERDLDVELGFVKL
ncbi:hypothetical protein TSUD_341110 [Trifolium subterraneum]|uniref:MATH domain-containing protein n=1 Tax=Trifolium subterraneum TaxID=3900 RepID=A0A2Z6LNI6_TRISU|nr:hypothetical protein TSUD_341110 [Trifolium subterraneum]